MAFDNAAGRRNRQVLPYQPQVSTLGIREENEHTVAHRVSWLYRETSVLLSLVELMPKASEIQVT